MITITMKACPEDGHEYFPCTNDAGDLLGTITENRVKDPNGLDWHVWSADGHDLLASFPTLLAASEFAQGRFG